MLDLFKRNKVTFLKKKSDIIFNVFTKTLVKLKDVNKQLDSEINSRNEEIKRIQGEQHELGITKAINVKMINKIDNFINE